VSVTAVDLFLPHIIAHSRCTEGSEFLHLKAGKPAEAARKLPPGGT
jgi:hypothetical protein